MKEIKRGDAAGAPEWDDELHHPLLDKNLQLVKD
jgi:hypothetical protein